MRRALMVLVIVAAAFAGDFDLLVGHCDPGMTSGVQTNIGGDPYYDSFTLEDWRYSTPTLDHLENYGCVFTWSNYNYSDGTTLGNRLADYVDAGGTVVINNFCWTSNWGLYGRIQTDPDYAPITHMGSGAYTNTNLGDYDDTHEFMDGVSSISGIYYWTFVNKESPATWVADNTSGYVLVAVNEDYNVAGVNMYPGDYRYWSGDGWTMYNNIIQNLMEGQWYPGDPPYVDGMDPDDGDTGVSVYTDIVFHCCHDLFRIDIDTIVFTVEDQSRRSGGRALGPASALVVGQVDPHPAGEISGTLDIDDTDPLDVLCTFDPDEDLPVDRITCTVAAGLSTIRGDVMEEDFVWSFTTGNYGVETTTWGTIKAGF
jgi:hypothetical protein